MVHGGNSCAKILADDAQLMGRERAKVDCMVLKEDLNWVYKWSFSSVKKKNPKYWK